MKKLIITLALVLSSVFNLYAQSGCGCVYSAQVSGHVQVPSRVLLARRYVTISFIDPSGMIKTVTPTPLGYFSTTVTSDYPVIIMVPNVTENGRAFFPDNIFTFYPNYRIIQLLFEADVHQEFILEKN